MPGHFKSGDAKWLPGASCGPGSSTSTSSTTTGFFTS